ncbi:hypothetical protein AVEN_219598-1 [Araneus ventricosus]|uniref:Uncharacterized protein n=1 Tax=Araneus ventricosus TaxID=182803 RepID=A0A4Y2WYE1_ARAVE|nr:hypothetical protein AVEN_219598-1 [Araneus ventricosus]
MPRPQRGVVVAAAGCSNVPRCQGRAVVFAFVGEPLSPRSYFNYMTRREKWKANENPKLPSDYVDSYRNFALTTGFRAARSKLRGEISPRMSSLKLTHSKHQTAVFKTITRK